jgi:hypothetical protein
MRLQDVITQTTTPPFKFIYFKEKLYLLAYNAVLLSESLSAFWRNTPPSFQDQRVSQATNQQEAGSKQSIFFIM